MSEQFFVVEGLAGRNCGFYLDEIWVDEDLATVNADAKSDLVQSAAFTLQSRNCLVDSMVGDKAPVYPQETVAPALDETDLTSALGGETDVIAVTPGIVGADGCGHRGFSETADAAQLLLHDVPFEGKLMGIGNVLPLTAATLAEVRTGRLDSVRRRRQHLDDAPNRDSCPPASNLDDRCLARQAVIGEYGHRIALAHGATLERHVCQVQRYPFRRLHLLFVLPAGHT
jgi:hypothetical protein